MGWEYTRIHIRIVHDVVPHADAHENDIKPARLHSYEHYIIDADTRVRHIRGNVSFSA